MLHLVDYSVNYLVFSSSCEPAGYLRAKLCSVCSCRQRGVYALKCRAEINRNDCIDLIGCVCVCSVPLCNNWRYLEVCVDLAEVSDYALRFLCDCGSRGNCVCLTIVCEYALRSDHLIADMADNKRKILQCWKLAVDKHL